ncbi:MAG: DUF134 domain-containing protein [Candidatus Omnitrophica bacterium]|nr:DUF134 domain-containing protein [Candidatus Omnitrophota bacterium]
MLRGRPKKKRIIKQQPRISFFSPRGKPGRPDEVCIGMDEFETVRLYDFLGQSQKEAAKSMNISQQTFSRILKQAHRALADVLINGKIIRIAKPANPTE